MTPTSISFVIPMYNEKETIESTINLLISMAGELSEDYEIIIADDGSSDGSGAQAERLSEKNKRIKVIHLEKNTKFGGALSAGLLAATKEIIIYTDSDLPVDIKDIKGALSVMDGSDIVTAYSRVKKGENLKRVIMSLVYNFLIQVFFRTNIKDINSGLKIYKQKVFEEMKLISKSPFIDVEIFIKAIRKGCVIKQYPIVFKNRKYGASYISKPAVVLKTMADMFKFRFKS